MRNVSSNMREGCGPLGNDEVLKKLSEQEYEPHGHVVFVITPEATMTKREEYD